MIYMSFVTIKSWQYLQSTPEYLQNILWPEDTTHMWIHVNWAKYLSTGPNTSTLLDVFHLHIHGVFLTLEMPLKCAIYSVH